MLSPKSVVSIILGGCMGAALAAGQEPVQPADAPAASQPAAVYVPMSVHERWHGYLHENLLGTKFILQLFGSAMISHLNREPREWGQSAHGYFHRLENRFFTGGIDGAVHSSLAAALHHDTRYIPYRGRAGGLRRARHAVERTFLTYNESGQRVLDVSGLAGIYGSSMTSQLWRPHCDPLGRGIRAGNIGMVAQAGANLLKEFGPDLKRTFMRSRD